ncbi:MAG: hypothetical protein WAU69_04250 [Solirubrobacteraceae bacterium]
MDCREHLETLKDRDIPTITRNKPNRVLAIRGSVIEVMREQRGTVPIAHVQQALDALYENRSLRINKATLGHSDTAFIGAVLAQLPDVEVIRNPQSVLLPSADG